MSRLQHKQPIAVTCPSHQVNNITVGGREGGRCKKQTVCEAQEVRTHCEANAHGGGEGPWDELALVILNQQRGLAHAAVSHQDRLQREAQKTLGHAYVLHRRLRLTLFVTVYMCMLLGAL